MKDRLKEVILILCDGNKSKFGREIGVSPGNVSDWLAGRSEPTAKILRRIYNKFHINPSWLISGTGEMSDILPLSNDEMPQITNRSQINDYSTKYNKRKNDLNYDIVFRNLPENDQVGLVFRVIYEWSFNNKQLLYNTLALLLKKQEE